MSHLRSSLYSPDISFAVGQSVRFCKNPGKAHWAAVKRILSYLAGTTTHGILFSGEGRTSTSGYIFLHLGGAISWGSKRQSCTAISTTEAEYVAASNATQEAVWIQRLLGQIGQLPPCPVRILCDNQSAISLVHNPAHHQRTKHIDVKFHFIREKQASNFIDIVYIDTQHQLADIFTKPLSTPQFNFIRARIGVVPLF